MPGVFFGVGTKLGLLKQLFRYGLVGVINTLITFIIIVILTHFAVNPYISNAAGFAVGLVNSYILNSKFTFKQRSSTGSVLKFSISFAGAYCLNLTALHYLVLLAPIPTILSQLSAMIVYNVAFFIFMKAWVFAND